MPRKRTNEYIGTDGAPLFRHGDRLLDEHGWPYNRRGRGARTIFVRQEKAPKSGGVTVDIADVDSVALDGDDVVIRISAAKIREVLAVKVRKAMKK